MNDRLVPELIFKDKALNVDGKPNLITDIRLNGKAGWTKANLEIAIILVVGTGTGAISEGELAFIRSIGFKTDVDGETHPGCSGRALYREAHLLTGTAPVKDAIAAASATYRVNIPLLFSDPLSANPFDTILDTGRYKGVELAIVLGSVADLLGTVGTSSVTAMATLTVERTQGALSPDLWPEAYPYHKQYTGVTYTELQKDLDQSPDMRLRRVIFCNTTSPVAGVPFSGTPADDSIKEITLEHGNGYFWKDADRRQIADEMARELDLITARPTGFFMLNLMKDGLHTESVITDPDVTSKLRFSWKTDSATAAAVNLLTDCTRALKPVRNRA